MQKWEYKEVKDPFLKHLNDLGLEGWELIAINAVSSGAWFYAFKRPLQEEISEKDTKKVNEKS